MVPEKEDFTITTINVDPEIAAIAGPQLVVPVDNARYALNAANARWGSLYDALYGTNIIPEEYGVEKGSRYNPVRGARVIAYTDHFLDETVTLSKGSYCQATAFMLEELQGKQQLIVMLQDEKKRTWQILPNLWDTGKAMEN